MLRNYILRTMAKKRQLLLCRQPQERWWKPAAVLTVSAWWCNLAWCPLPVFTRWSCLQFGKRLTIPSRLLFTSLYFEPRVNCGWVSSIRQHLKGTVLRKYLEVCMCCFRVVYICDLCLPIGRLLLWLKYMFVEWLFLFLSISCSLFLENDRNTCAL